MDRPDGIVDFTPDPTLYPFESRWFESKVGPVHYIDEGEGPTVLLMHGNPDWSFLYRKIITALGPEVRCVAPDYPGFGLSVHPSGYGYTPAEHADVVRELVDHLDLTHMVVMGQDWGGPIGMDVASRSSDRVAGIVMANTWFWPGDDRMTKFFSRMMGSPPMQMLIKRRNFFVTGVMKRMLQVKLSDKEFAHYTDPVPSPESREGIAVFPKEILNSHPWLGELETRVAETLRGKPASFVFGKKDPALASDGTIARWREEFPDANCVEVPDAGHFIQEDDPDACVAAIREVLALVK
jgi:haloalkane dehalogenase